MLSFSFFPLKLGQQLFQQFVLFARGLEGSIGLKPKQTKALSDANHQKYITFLQTNFRSCIMLLKSFRAGIRLRPAWHIASSGFFYLRRKQSLTFN